MLGKYIKSARQAAKLTGFSDILFLRRKHVAMLFGSVWGVPLQAVPTNTTLIDLPSVRGGRTALADATGLIRSALAAEGFSSGFLKSMRCLTKHKCITETVT